MASGRALCPLTSVVDTGRGYVPFLGQAFWMALETYSNHPLREGSVFVCGTFIYVYKVGHI